MEKTMSLASLDTDKILSYYQPWMELQEKWGEPVDLDTQEPQHSPASETHEVTVSFSSLNRTTFDSSKFINQLKRKKNEAPDYGEFEEGIKRKMLRMDSTGDNLQRQSSEEFFKVPSGCSTVRERHTFVDCWRPTESGEFSKMVLRVRQELTQLERYGRPRRSGRASRADVRQVHWNVTNCPVTYV